MARRQTKPGSGHPLKEMESPVRRYSGRVDSQRTTEKFLRASHSGADRQAPPHRDLSAPVE